MFDASRDDAPIARVEQEATTELGQLGLRFAREVAGNDSVDPVEVVRIVDVVSDPYECSRWPARC